MPQEEDSMEELKRISLCVKNPEKYLSALETAVAEFEPHQEIWHFDEPMPNDVPYLQVSVSLSTQGKLIDALLQFVRQTNEFVTVYHLPGVGLNSTAFTITPNSSREWSIDCLEIGLRESPETIEMISVQVSRPFPISLREELADRAK